MAPMQAHAGMGTTKKRRNFARGAAKAKKDARAYIAPGSFPARRKVRHTYVSKAFGNLTRRGGTMRTTGTMRMVVAIPVPY